MKELAIAFGIVGVYLAFVGIYLWCNWKDITALSDYDDEV